MIAQQPVVSSSRTDEDFALSVTADFMNVHNHGMFCRDQSCQTCVFTALGLFIRTMGRWEVFLENSIVDEMCATKPVDHSPTPYGRERFATKDHARLRLRATLYDAETGTVTEDATTRGYILLHEPPMIRAVADHWVANSIVGKVTADSEELIVNIIQLRHAAAHGTSHSQELLQPAIRYFADGLETRDVGSFLASRRPNGQLMLAHVVDELLEVAKRMKY